MPYVDPKPTVILKCVQFLKCCLLLWKTPNFPGTVIPGDHSNRRSKQKKKSLSSADIQLWWDSHGETEHLNLEKVKVTVHRLQSCERMFSDNQGSSQSDDGKIVYSICSWKCIHVWPLNHSDGWDISYIHISAIYLHISAML